MAGKQIIDLASADSFNEGDLLLVRKSGMGVDRKITYADFIESIGNSGINGYTSELEDGDANKIILKAVNKVPVYKYCEGMRVSFMVPAKSTGVVQIRIGELGYKNLYRHKSDITVSLDKDDYVEALLIEDHFYQINDFEPVTDVELESTDSFNEGDLLLLKKHGTEIDKIITYTNFLESIGNSGINGYVAYLDNSQANKIILKAANNAPINKYYVGMRVTFIVPAKTTGVVQVRIGDLDYKNLYRHKSDITVSLDKDDYVEALFIDDNFYQINDLKSVTNVFTNDYTCIAHEISNNDTATDLTLITAYGLHKQEYYNGMSITFTCPIDTKGAVKINIDGLGSKGIIEGDTEDFLNSPLYKGQIVQAIFNGVCFVKNKFESQNPKIRPSLEPSISSSPEENPQPIIPLENILEYNVGKGLIGCNINFHFSTLREALEEILSKYSDNSGRKVTLNILSELTTSKDSVVIENRDLSWITLKGNVQNKIKIFGDHQYQNAMFFTLDSCKNFNFAKGTTIIYDIIGVKHGGGFFVLTDCNIDIKDITIEFINNTSHVLNLYTFLIKGCSITMNNVTVKSGDNTLRIDGDKKSIISLTNCKFNHYHKGHNLEFNSPNSELTLTNCDLSKKGASYIDDIYIMRFANVTQINSRAKVRYHGGNGTCAPNTSDNHARYIVIGSQDEVGTDN